MGIQRGIAAALNVSEPNVHGVKWISGRRLLPVFLGSNSRRLDTKYTVSYEVIVKSASGVVAMPRTSPDVPLNSDGQDSSNLVGIVIGCIVGSFFALFVIGLLCYCAYSVRQRKSGQTEL